MVEPERVECTPARRNSELQDQGIRRIRARSSYELFRRLYDFLKDSPDIATILRKVYSILDARRGFGSQRNAEYAAESLDWVLKDAGEDVQRLSSESRVF